MQNRMKRFIFRESVNFRFGFKQFFLHCAMELGGAGDLGGQIVDVHLPRCAGGPESVRFRPMPRGAIQFFLLPIFLL